MTFDTAGKLGVLVNGVFANCEFVNCAFINCEFVNLDSDTRVNSPSGQEMMMESCWPQKRQPNAPSEGNETYNKDTVDQGGSGLMG